MLPDLARLAALAAAAPQRPPNITPGRWTITAAAAGSRTKVHLYGYIGPWEDVEAGPFVKALDDVGPDGIDLHINSGGGSAFDGLAIYAALKRHPSDVDVYIDSLAASAASFVAMSGDRIMIEPTAKMMIHRASAITWGTADDLRTNATALDEIDQAQAEIYAGRAGGSVGAWYARMKATTWYGAKEAVKAGLADSMVGDDQADDAGDAAAAVRREQLIRARARARARR